MISYFALHQLGYGDIHLPIEAHQDEDGLAVAETAIGEVLSHAPINEVDGSVYYDAVACYNEFGHRVKLFWTDRKWIKSGETVSISANDL